MVTTMPYTSRRRLLPAAALLLALATPAGAQESEFDSWLVPGWSVTPGLRIGAVRDNNVALAAPTETGPADADSLFAIEPFGSLEFRSPRTQFSTGYRGYLRRYMEVPELNGFDQRLHIQLRHHATKRLIVFVRDNYLDVPTTDEVQLNGLPFIRTGARTNTFQSGIEARLSKFTDLIARYDLAWVDFDNEGTLLTGGWVNGVNTTLNHRLNARTSVGAEYSVRFADLNEGTRFMTFHDVGGVFSYQLAEHTTFSAAAGISRLADELLDETRTAPYFRAGLTHRLETAILGASYERSFVPAFGFGGSNESQEVRGFVDMPIPSNRAYVQGMVAWRRSIPFLSTALQLDSILTRATVGYALARWFRVEAFHAFTRQDSVVTGGEINRHRVGVQMVISRPMRIH
jgi:hypothetical protein